jgi:hypothetical protein
MIYLYYENLDEEKSFKYLKKYKIFYQYDDSEKLLIYYENKLSKSDFLDFKLNYLKNFTTFFVPTFEIVKIYFKINDFKNSFVFLKNCIGLIVDQSENVLIQKFIFKKLKLFEIGSEYFNILNDLDSFRIDYSNYFEILD